MCADGMSFPDMVRKAHPDMVLKAAILISKRFKHKNMDEEFLYSRREKYRVTGRTEEGLVLLEDTGCSHAGPPCRIAVEPEGDGYRFVKCLNGTAESYKMYHMDYTYYTGQADAKRDGIRWQIDRYRKLQSVLKEQLESTVRLCGVCKTDKRRDCRFDPFTTESVYVMPVDYKDGNGVIRVRVNEITVTPEHEVIQFTVNPHMAGGAYFENLRFGPEKELFHAARYNG